MENRTRDRAKEYFPAVLLTLLSIVQAIALELLWGKVVSTDALYTISAGALIGWAQIGATLLGLMLIWVVYASNVMRFSWVPTISDSVYPFLVGIIQFALVESIGADTMGLWIIAMGAIVGVMFWITQLTMRRARLDGDNDEFFDGVAPATLADFYPRFILVGALTLAGAYLLMNPDSTGFGAIMAGCVLVYLVIQFRTTARFWAQATQYRPGTGGPANE